jgi:hypothetical protein
MKRISAVLLAAVLLLAGVLPLSASEPWRPGHIYCPDASKAAPGGALPAGTRIVLEDGTAVEASTLASQDAFQKLLDHWVKARTGYKSDPGTVSTFVYRLDTVDMGSGARSVEIRYSPSGVIARNVKGVTWVIK